MKGAPEVVLERCAPVDGALEAIESFADLGMRVLALAEKRGTDGFRLLGLAALVDPPRESALTAVGACRAAGVDVKMITGDHVSTARAIAARFGLGGAALTGRELDALDDAALDRAAGGDHGVRARRSGAQAAARAHPAARGRGRGDDRRRRQRRACAQAGRHRRRHGRVRHRGGARGRRRGPHRRRLREHRGGRGGGPPRVRQHPEGDRVRPADQPRRGADHPRRRPGLPVRGRRAAPAGRADADPLGQPDRHGDARPAARGRGDRAGLDEPPAAPAATRRSSGAS